jgi:hypothetical protein
MSDIVLLNRYQKKALVIELYNQGKTLRQIAEIVHMSFKDIADVINEYTGEVRRVNKPAKSKDAQAFELFLQGKQSVEVAIELDMPADREQGEHGSGAADETGKPSDPNHWGDSASDFGNDGIMGDHSKEGSAPSEAPFDGRDDTKGRIGVGNNVGDGPSGHGACVDGDSETTDPDCPGA